MCPSNLQGQVPPHSHIATGQGATTASEQIAQSVCKPLLPAPRSLAGLSPGKVCSFLDSGDSWVPSQEAPLTQCHQCQVPQGGAGKHGRSITQPPLLWPLFCFSASLLLYQSSADRKQRTAGHGQDQHLGLLLCSFPSFSL